LGFARPANAGLAPKATANKHAVKTRRRGLPVLRVVTVLSTTMPKSLPSSSLWLLDGTTNPHLARRTTRPSATETTIPLYLSANTLIEELVLLTADKIP